VVSLIIEVEDWQRSRPPPATLRGYSALRSATPNQPTAIGAQTGPPCVSEEGLREHFGGLLSAPVALATALATFSTARNKVQFEEDMKTQKDAIELLKADHAAVKKLFKTADQSSRHAGKEKTAIFTQIRAALEVHATIEEEIFYPAVKQARSEHVKDEVREGYEEHKQIKALLAALSAISPTDENYNMKLKVLKEDVEHHVKDEEGEMFPDAEKYVGKRRLASLGTQMDARKQQLEEGHSSKGTTRAQDEIDAAK
jgi:hemerythrin superfamily protein